MVNKYLECLAVEGNYSKARIGLLLLGIFSLSVFIWLIVLTVQVGNAGKESAGGACADLSGTWNCSATDPKIPDSQLVTYVQKKCTGVSKETLYTVCGHTVTSIDGSTINKTNTAEVNELITEIKYNYGVCRKVSGSVTAQPTEKPATTNETPEPDTTTTTTTTAKPPAPKKCKTKPTQAKNNPVPGADCIFPFTYKEKSHDSCTKAGGDFFWCATTVDNKTTKMVSGKWGQCDDYCVKEGKWKDLGPGCCSDGEAHRIFRLSLKDLKDGSLDTCKKICLDTNSKCKFINYGWNDGNTDCIGISSDASCKTLDTSQEGCISGGDTGVHSYEYEKEK